MWESYMRSAAAVYSLGRVEEAAELAAKAACAAGQFGPDDPRRVETLNRLGVLEAALGNFERAEMALEQAVKLFRRMAKDVARPELAACLHNLAAVYREAGRGEEAEALAQEAAALGDAGLALDPPALFTRRAIKAKPSGGLEAAVAEKKLGDYYLRRERYIEAELHYLQALRIQRGVAGEGDGTLAGIFEKLSELYLERKGRRSERLLMEVLRAAEGAPRRDIDAVLARLAEACRALGRLSEAGRIAELRKGLTRTSAA